MTGISLKTYSLYSKEQDNCIHLVKVRLRKRMVGWQNTSEEPPVLALVACVAASGSAEVGPVPSLLVFVSIAVLGQDGHWQSSFP